MKRLFFALLVIVCFTACSVDDHKSVFYEIVPVTGVELPKSLVQGQTYRLSVAYLQPSNCHTFGGFDYNRNRNELVIGAINYYFENDPTCDGKETPAEAVLNFYVERNDFYIFKFWTGDDEDGEPQFLTYEIPVGEAPVEEGE